MKKISYNGYRFPAEFIHQAIWLYLRFTLSLRDVEDLLAERGVTVSYETVRRWANHFGPMIAADLRKRRLKPHTTCWGGRVRRETGREVRGESPLR
jgi:putative transposase